MVMLLSSHFAESGRNGAGAMLRLNSDAICRSQRAPRLREVDNHERAAGRALALVPGKANLNECAANIVARKQRRRGREAKNSHQLSLPLSDESHYSRRAFGCGSV